jgi:mycothiol synthase
MTSAHQAQQLQMLWPSGMQPTRFSPDSGYLLRQWHAGEENAHAQLMHAAGFNTWTAAQLKGVWLAKILKDGFFIIEHSSTRTLAATAMATHAPRPSHPGGAELGWVAGDPCHAGKNLGMVVCSAATWCMWNAGYTRMYLLTDDARLPAIRTYLKLGWQPRICNSEHRDRWQAVCASLSLPYSPIVEDEL